jgi:hypothetical protein
LISRRTWPSAVFGIGWPKYRESGSSGVDFITVRIALFFLSTRPLTAKVISLGHMGQGIYCLQEYRPLEGDNSLMMSQEVTFGNQFLNRSISQNRDRTCIIGASTVAYNKQLTIWEPSSYLYLNLRVGSS